MQAEVTSVISESRLVKSLTTMSCLHVISLCRLASPQMRSQALRSWQLRQHTKPQLPPLLLHLPRWAFTKLLHFCSCSLVSIGYYILFWWCPADGIANGECHCTASLTVSELAQDGEAQGVVKDEQEGSSAATLEAVQPAAHDSAAQGLAAAASALQPSASQKPPKVLYVALVLQHYSALVST